MPPGPKLSPLLQTLGFLASPRRFIAAMHRRYGPLVTLSTAFDSGFVMVFEPELVKEVFRGSPEQLRAGEANAVLGAALGRHLLLLLVGEEMLRERSLLSPAFDGQRMRA
jgi:cytochrome P450